MPRQDSVYSSVLRACIQVRTAWQRDQADANSILPFMIIHAQAIPA
jgi:hypothetical protein